MNGHGGETLNKYVLNYSYPDGLETRRKEDGSIDTSLRTCGWLIKLWWPLYNHPISPDILFYLRFSILFLLSKLNFVPVLNLISQAALSYWINYQINQLLQRFNNAPIPVIGFLNVGRWPKGKPRLANFGLMDQVAGKYNISRCIRKQQTPCLIALPLLLFYVWAIKSWSLIFCSFLAHFDPQPCTGSRRTLESSAGIRVESRLSDTGLERLASTSWWHHLLSSMVKFIFQFYSNPWKTRSTLGSTFYYWFSKMTNSECRISTDNQPLTWKGLCLRGL